MEFVKASLQAPKPSPQQTALVVFWGLGACVAWKILRTLLAKVFTPYDPFRDTYIKEGVEENWRVVGKISDPTLEDIPDLVAEMRESYLAGRSRPIAKREEQLRALLRLFDENQEAIIAAIQADLGRPRLEARVYDLEVPRHDLVSLIKNLRTWLAPNNVPFNLLSFPSKDQAYLEPQGTVLIIGTWNYPVMLTLLPLAGAIAGGNTVVMKLSNISGTTARLLGRLIPKYLDPSIVTVAGLNVPGDRACITALLQEKFDHIFFTGGPMVGKLVMQAASRHLCPVTLELGGKNPVIVTADANIDLAARRAVWGRMMNAGQQCVAPDYVLVDKRVEQQFLSAARAAVRTMYGESGSARLKASVGRIVNDRHMARLKTLLDNHGGKIVVGGKMDVASRYIEPTVLSLPELGCDAMADETFGPILMVVGVDSVDQAIEYVNSRPKPLSMYIFSSSNDTQDRIVSSTSAGGVTINATLFHCAHPHLPFGGVGNSGMGAYHGKATLTTFTHSKPVLRKAVWKLDGGVLSDPFFVYPPWTSFKENLFCKLIRLS